MPPTLYASAGPLCFWKDFICFIALPPWTHTSDHIHPISHSFIIPFPLPLPLGHFKTHVDIHNSIVSPQDPWCCCHSRAGYNFGRNFYVQFSFHFIHSNYMFLCLSGCVGKTSLIHVFTVICAKLFNLKSHTVTSVRHTPGTISNTC